MTEEKVHRGKPGKKKRSWEKAIVRQMKVKGLGGWGCRGHVSEREWEIKPVLVGRGLPAAPDSLFKGLGWVASYSHKKSSKMSSKFQSQTIQQKINLPALFEKNKYTNADCLFIVSGCMQFTMQVRSQHSGKLWDNDEWRWLRQWGGVFTRFILVQSRTSGHSNSARNEEKQEFGFLLLLLSSASLCNLGLLVPQCITLHNLEEWRHWYSL